MTRQFGDPPEEGRSDSLGRILMRSEGKWFTGGAPVQSGPTRDPCRDCGLLGECVRLDEMEDNSLLKLCAGVLGRDKVFVGLHREESLEIVKTADGASSQAIRDVFIRIDGTWFRAKDKDRGRHVCAGCHIRDACIPGRTTAEGLSFFHFCCGGLPYGQCLKKADSTDITVFHGNSRDWPVIQPPLIFQESGSTGSPQCSEIKTILIRDDKKTWHRGPEITGTLIACNSCSLFFMCSNVRAEQGSYTREMRALSDFCCSVPVMEGKKFNRMTWNDTDEACLLAGFRSARVSGFAYNRPMSLSLPKSRAGRADGRCRPDSAEILPAEPVPAVKDLYVRESGKWYKTCHTTLFHPKFDRKFSDLWDGSEGKKLFWDLLDRFFWHSSGVRPVRHLDIIQEIEEMESRT